MDPLAAAAALCKRLGGMAGVRWAEPDWVIRPLGEPTDPEFNRQWNMRAIGAPSGARSTPAMAPPSATGTVFESSTPLSASTISVTYQNGDSTAR